MCLQVGCRGYFLRLTRPPDFGRLRRGRARAPAVGCGPNPGDPHHLTRWAGTPRRIPPQGTAPMPNHSPWQLIYSRLLITSVHGRFRSRKYGGDGIWPNPLGRLEEVPTLAIIHGRFVQILPRCRAVHRRRPGRAVPAKFELVEGLDSIATRFSGPEPTLYRGY